MSKNLTTKQEAFCLAAVTSDSASEAYRKVYNTSRMNEKTVWEAASRMMADPRIEARIAELRAQVAKEVVLTEARVLEEVARIGLFDPRKLFNADGSPKQITELDDATAAAIAGLEVIEQFEGSGQDRKFVGYLKKYKIADKNVALEKLMKHLGMFEKDNKQKAGMFDNVPRDTLRMIEDKLRGLTTGQSGVAGNTAAGSPSRFTH
ncbi:MAG: terminase small subunit [Mizugakiibacter sp.]|uniref:terminase small subunit n=1 Tax=Mizugakiibacter sp. TaxID=1972610 RepID=UPI00320D1D56